MLIFEAKLTNSLEDLKTAVQQKLGILTEQQRLIVVGKLSFPTGSLILLLLLLEHKISSHD